MTVPLINQKFVGKSWLNKETKLSFIKKSGQHRPKKAKTCELEQTAMEEK